MTCEKTGTAISRHLELLASGCQRCVPEPRFPIGSRDGAAKPRSPPGGVPGRVAAEPEENPGTAANASPPQAGARGLPLSLH